MKAESSYNFETRVPSCRVEGPAKGADAIQACSVPPCPISF